MTTKEVEMRNNVVASQDAEPVSTLQAAIDMAWGTTGHIHETEQGYLVCYGYVRRVNGIKTCVVDY